MWFPGVLNLHLSGVLIRVRLLISSPGHQTVLILKRKIRLSYPEFVLTGVICIENAMKGTSIVFVPVYYTGLELDTPKVTRV